MAEPQHGKDCLDAIRQLATENHQQKNTIISSTITYIEVLAIKIGDDNEALFRKSFRTQDHIAYDVDPPIALKARDLRERFVDDKTGRKLHTPDAIHLATAIIHKADHFLTLDGKLLKLNGDDRLEGLVIGNPLSALKDRQRPLI
jgi:predicted nucleic acid-binding protein